MRRVAHAVLLGFTVVLAGCSLTPDVGFATKNAEVDMDLQSIVRAQSNGVLTSTLELTQHADSGFKSTKKLDRDLNASITQMDQLHLNLPTLLAAQDVELAELLDLVTSGAIPRSDFKARARTIKVYRTSLVSSLKASETRATTMADKLRTSLNTGRPDLKAQNRTAQNFARDLYEARVMIEMQL